ncbi:MAG: biopolymer transport protein ExbD [Bacteroidia bacterium]|jgi:biopolymer transport protein ExbD
MKRKLDQSHSALADIAMLLLIFFLVTTQFPKEEGITTMLPPMHLQSASTDYIEIEIWLNESDQVMVNQHMVSVIDLSKMVYEQLGQTTGKTRVNLKSHVRSSYTTYVQVYDQVKKAYRLLYDSKAYQQFGKSFNRLSSQEKAMIQTQHPMSVFEGDLVQ